MGATDHPLKRRPELHAWRHRLVGLLLTSACLSPATVQAIDRIRISVGDIQGPGLLARDVRLDLELQGTVRGHLQIAELALEGVSTPVTDLRLTCREIALPPDPPACLDAYLESRHPALSPLLGEGGLSLSIGRQADGSWQISFPAQPLAQGRIDLLARLGPRQWSARGMLAGAESANLLAALGEVLPYLPVATAEGPLDLDFRLEGKSSGLPKGHLTLRSTRLTVANDDSTVASDSLAGTVQLALSPTPDRLHLQGEARMEQGFAYIHPLLQNYGDHPLSLKADLHWWPRSGAIELNRLDWEQRRVVTASATGSWHPEASPSLQRLDVTVADGRLPGLYTQLLLPMTSGTPLDELESSGRLHGGLRIEDGQLRAIDLAFDALHLDDRQRRFAVYDLQGSLAWRASMQAPRSTLQWEGAYLGRIPFGAGRWHFQATPDGLKTLAPLEVDFFDGRLQISRLDGEGLPTGEPELKLQATLEPVSLALITTALGWPSFPGEISGRLPLLHYRDGELVVDGQIEARAFGGQLTVDQARLTAPLGRVPRMQADLRLRDLDLAMVTSVFDFGRVEGPLDADLLGLRLEAWEPVAFDARLYTPADTRKRRRISQRAVENISRIGGGGAVSALSTGFLQFFESFAYERIDWSCRLHDNICSMGGGRAVDGGGYLLVEGRGIPRISVVGHARRVSWSALLSQIKALSASAGPRLE